MRNYYAEDVSAHIEHYGVVGMRWGTRRANRAVMRSTISGAKKAKRAADSKNLDRLIDESSAAGDRYRASKKAAVAQRKAGNKGQVKNYVKSALTLNYKGMSNAANTIKTNNRAAKDAKKNASAKFDKEFDASTKRYEKRTADANKQAKSTISNAKNKYKKNKNKMSDAQAKAYGVDSKTAKIVGSKGTIRTAADVLTKGSYGSLVSARSTAKGKSKADAKLDGKAADGMNFLTLGGKSRKDQKQQRKRLK